VEARRKKKLIGVLSLAVARVKSRNFRGQTSVGRPKLRSTPAPAIIDGILARNRPTIRSPFRTNGVVTRHVPAWMPCICDPCPKEGSRNGDGRNVDQGPGRILEWLVRIERRLVYCNFRRVSCAPCPEDENETSRAKPGSALVRTEAPRGELAPHYPGRRQTWLHAHLSGASSTS